MRILHIFTACLLAICDTNTSYAQKRSYTDSLLLQQFAKGTRLEWQRTYFARLDDITELELHLGFDGTHVNGWGRYPQTNLIHTFQGFLNQQSLFLVELDPQSQPIATIETTLENKKTSGQRITAGRKLAKRFEATIQSAKESSESPDANKWYRKYTGKWNDKEVEICISRLQSDMMIGQISLADGQVFELKGQVGREEKFIAKLYDQTGAIAGTIKGNADASSKTSFTVEMLKNPKAYIHSSLESQLNITCLQEQVGNAFIDAVYPRTKSDPLNELLEERVETWVSDMKSTLNARNFQQDKSEHLATLWSNLTCWKDDLACIVLTSHSSIDTNWQAQTILYHTKKKKELAIGDLFQERFDYQTWFKAQVLKHLPGIKPYKDDVKYAKWLDKHGFPVVYVRNDGIILSTLFHPIYGTSQILLNWETLKPYLRPQPALKELVK